MANNFLSGGLLGWGGLGGSQPAYSSLLGDMYDPQEARKAQMKQMLIGMGMGLMSEKGFGRGAELALAMGSRAADDYRQSALDAYRLKSDEEQRQYGRSRDALADERWEKEYGLRQKDAAWQGTERQRQLDEWQRADDLRAGQQSAVQGFTQDFTGQGGDLFDSGMQSWLRGQGVEGVDPMDTQRYNKMQPYMAAQDYGGAFQQMTAEPAAPNLEFGAPGSGIFQDGKYIGTVPGERKDLPTDLQILGQINTERQAAGQPPMSTEEFMARKKGGGIKISPDGTIQIGGASGGTEGDRRAGALYNQIAKQEPQIMAGFDALSQPQNYAGSNVPGGAAIMTPEAQVAADAITNVVANWLYLTSGATATDDEIKRQTAMVTPGPFDSAQRKAAKKARLKQIISTMKDRAGVQTPPVEVSVEDLLQQYGGE